MDYLSNYRMSIFGVKVGTHLSVRKAFQIKLLPSGTAMAKMTSQGTSQSYSLLPFVFATKNNTRESNNLQIILKSLHPDTWLIRIEMTSLSISGIKPNNPEGAKQRKQMLYILGRN